LCGGADAHVVIVPYASGTIDFASKEELEGFTKRWTDAGAKSVTVLDLSDEPRALEAVQTSDFIFFSGGDQKDLMTWMDKSPTVMNATRKRHAAGALIGGSSAGAAAMSKLMIVGGETADLTAIRSAGTQLSNGLGFWPEVITDQHFVKRQRFARLFSAVLDNPKYPGIGIDEATTVLVSGNTFEVFGSGSVIVLDARHADVKPAKPGEIQAATGMRVHVLRAGDRFKWE
jgi:cyanophycinase